MCNKNIYIFPSFSFDDAHAIRVIAHTCTTWAWGDPPGEIIHFPPLQLGMAQTCCSGLFGEGWRIALMPLAALRKLFSMFPFLSQLSCALFKKSLKIIYSHSRAREPMSLCCWPAFLSPSSILSRQLLSLFYCLRESFCRRFVMSPVCVTIYDANCVN